MIKIGAETLDLIVASVNPVDHASESAQKMLNGDWHIQSFGVEAKSLMIRVYCDWAVLNDLMRYASDKERLTVEYLDFDKQGYIINGINYEVFSRGGVKRLYLADFELAVMGDV